MESMEVDGMQKKQDGKDGEMNGVKMFATECEDKLQTLNPNNDASEEVTAGAIKQTVSSECSTDASVIKTNGEENALDANENGVNGNDEDIDKLMNAATSICYAKDSDTQKRDSEVSIDGNSIESAKNSDVSADDMNSSASSVHSETAAAESVEHADMSKSKPTENLADLETKSENLSTAAEERNVSDMPKSKPTENLEDLETKSENLDTPAEERDVSDMSKSKPTENLEDLETKSENLGTPAEERDVSDKANDPINEANPGANPESCVDAPEKPPLKKARKRKSSFADSPVRIQPKRTASSKISFKEPKEIDDDEDVQYVSESLPPHSAEATKPVGKAEKTPPKVTVIELGNSSLKLSDILRKEKNLPQGPTRVFGNSSMTISSTRSVPRANQVSINKLPTNICTTQPILKSHLQPQQMQQNVKVTSNQFVKSMLPTVYGVQLNRMSVADMIKNKSQVATAVKQIVSTSKVEAPPPDEPTFMETIDEKEEYDRLKWEIDTMFPYIRPGRFIPPSPNETMSFAMCNERLVECASKVTPFLLRYPNIPKIEGYKYKKTFSNEPSSDSLPSQMDNGYFRGSLGNFFMEIGQRLVSEWVQKDLVRSRKRKMEKEGETEASVKSLRAMTTMHEQLRCMNMVFHFRQIKCNRCNFRTESSSVLQNHLETPHVFPSTYKYSCTCCAFDSRDLSAILVHMKLQHNIYAKIDPIPLFHQCPLCLYNSDKKQRMYSHVSKCSKTFKIQANQVPANDYSFPAKSFPPTWIHGQNFQRTHGNMSKSSLIRGQGLPASGYKTVVPLKPKIPLGSGRGRPPSAHSMFPPSTLVTKHPNPILVQDPRTKLYKLLNSNTESLAAQNVVSRQPGYQVRNPNTSGSPITIIKNTPVSQTTAGSSALTKSASLQKPSITLTPVSSSAVGYRDGREPTKATINGLQSITVPYKGGKGSHTFVICEICDGYIRDLEQLRAHMQWMHKVKIHPKMIHNRPPLNCQKCKFRFFTDQGLERHLLGIHGLVTSNMQESANKGEDAGRCSACGKLFQSKLLYHIAKVHKIALKPAHLSYKCTVCAATFTLYKLFEAHVYSMHTMQATTSSNVPNKPAPPTSAPKVFSRPGPLCSKKKPLPDMTNDDASISKATRILPQCPQCDKTVFNIERHWKDFHQRPFSVKLCRIEQCHKCLSEFDGFVVIHTDYFDSDSD